MVYLFSSMIAFPASLALASLGDPVGPMDLSMFEVLSDIGDHRIASMMEDYEEDLAKSVRDNSTPPELPSLQVRVPAGSRKALRRAYSLIYLVHEHALTTSYFNRTSPHSYPDPDKLEQALLHLATPELVDLELDRVSSQYASARGRHLMLI